ncbi:MAG: hypothetical protein GY708_14130 [Actinomycetia bacterium]|nr:hypothetical protein [Actinomycetes bacterium]
MESRQVVAARPVVMGRTEGDVTATEVFITRENAIDDATVDEGNPGDGVEAAFGPSSTTRAGA